MASDLQPPAAKLVHSMAGRARLRIDSRRQDGPYFDALARAIAEHEQVREVHVNADTASILIRHTGELSTILAFASGRGLWSLTASKPPSAMTWLRDGVDDLDAAISNETQHAVSLGRLAFVAFVGAGIWQVRRGMALPAGLTVFNYAWKALEWAAERERAMSQASSPTVTTL